MKIEFARLVRTSSSERHLLRRDGNDFAALDMHYLPDASVQATLTIFEGAGLEEREIPELLTYIDEVLLPEVRIDQGNLVFTVVIGRVLGAYQAEKEGRVATAE